MYSYTKRLLARYFTNCLWAFHQIYNFGAVGTMNWLDFEVRRSEVKVMTRPIKRHFGYLKLKHLNVSVTDSLSGEGKPVSCLLLGTI